jgi:DNA-directed RNA polymerase subunit N (RpoN/RPB10)
MSAPIASLATAELPLVDVAFECSKCGQPGASVWENYRGKPLMSRGFYERVHKAGWFEVEVVCNSCGTVVPKGMDSPNWGRELAPKAARCPL